VSNGLPTLDLYRLLARLKASEGFRDRPYRDTVGKLTIGYGWNLDAVPMPEQIAEAMLRHQALDAMADLDEHLSWWRQLDPVRQSVLADMCFNMGIGNGLRGLRSFRNTLAAIKEGRYADAAKGMRNSKWARQVGDRAVKLATMMETGQELA
jgi:lysozyme